MSMIDWGVIGFLIIVLLLASRKMSSCNRSVADFLVANRCAGRYMLGVAQGIAFLGAISIVALLEGYYASGFTFVWWGLLQLVVVRNIIALSGWIQYRFRETRALTMAQFLETRYSRNFRITAGITAFLSGLLNFGLFPSVGTRFFMHFCGLRSHYIDFFGLPLDLTYAGIMAILLTIALYFTFSGGQITVMVTDLIQGFFFNIILLIIVLFLLFTVPWAEISEVLLLKPAGQSMIDPFDSADIKTFNMWFYLILAFSQFWTHLAWQGGSAYYSSAINAHEARMGQVLGSWREYTQTLLIVILAICAYTVMHHQNWSMASGRAYSILNTISTNPENAIRQQVTTSVALSTVLPAGLMGGFAAIMLAAFISTHDSYLHSWGSIFIQDIVLPFRRHPLSPQTHIKWLKRAILGVALFIFLFSLFFPQTQAVLLFFALTGTLFLGGAGAVIVFGLYWKRGTTTAAYTSIFVGWILFAVGVYVELIWPKYHQGQDFPLNAQVRFFIAIISSAVLYVLVSLLTCKKPYDMDKLLHRGKHQVTSDHSPQDLSVRGWKALFGMDKNFNRKDQFIYIAIGSWSIFWALLFFAVLVVRLFIEIPDSLWMQFWHFYVWMAVVLGIVTTFWFLCGGVIDIRKMFHRLQTMERDDTDNGE